MKWGAEILALDGKPTTEVVSATVLPSIRAAQLTPVEVTFQGEVTAEEAGRVGGIARDERRFYEEVAAFVP